MNALVKSEDVAPYEVSKTMANVPLRDMRATVFELLGDHVVMPAQFHQDTETQLRHLTAAGMTAERDATEARGKLTQAAADIDLLQLQLREAHNRTSADAAVIEGLRGELRAVRNELIAIRGVLDTTSGDRDRLLQDINTPETGDFMVGLQREAVHQRERWGADNDTAKTPEDWVWLVGYLVNKALRNFVLATTMAEAADKMPVEGGHRAYLNAQADKAHTKAIHHIITTAAALANWHLNATGKDTRMAAGRDFAALEQPASQVGAAGDVEFF